MMRSSRRLKQQRVGIVTASVIGGVVVAGGVGAAAWAIFADRGDDTVPTTEPSASTAARPTPAPEPTAEPVDLPQAAVASGLLKGWQGVGESKVADILPAVGDAADGSVAAFLDAPVLDEPVDALTASVPVSAGTYTFSAQVRALQSLPAAVPAAVRIGDERVELPELDATWTEVSAEIDIPAGTTETTVALVLDDAGVGVAFDDLQLVPASGGDNVIPNPSFEEVEVPTGILNETLLLRQGSAAIAIGGPAGEATWQLRGRDGQVVSEGTADVQGSGIGSIPLGEIEQGFYEIGVKLPDGAEATTTLGIIEMDQAQLVADTRIGAITHVNQDWYAGAAHTLRSAGFASARNDVLWEFNERVQGQYDWDPIYVQAFERFHTAGVKVLPIVNYNNPLYDAGKTVSSETGVRAYADYAAAIADRFDVIGLEIFNEFNHDRFNNSTCGQSPVCYVPMLRGSHERAQAASADVPIVAGATANYDGRWLRDLWDIGGMQYADAASYHPYDPQYYDDPDNLRNSVADALDNMKAATGSTVPVWITEFGYTTGNQMGKAVTLDEQADRLVISEASTLGAGAEKFYWYSLIDDDTDPNSHEGNFGIFRQQVPNVVGLPPKPAAFAQALFVDALGNRQAHGLEDVGADIRSWKFGRAGDEVRVVWSTDGRKSVDYDATGPVTATELNGIVHTVEPKEGRVTIEFGESPLILEGEFGTAPTAPDSTEPPTQPPAQPPSETPAARPDGS